MFEAYCGQRYVYRLSQILKTEMKVDFNTNSISVPDVIACSNLEWEVDYLRKKLLELNYQVNLVSPDNS